MKIWSLMVAWSRLIVVLQVITIQACAQDKATEVLVMRLASPNKPINPTGKPFLIDIPPTYDEDAQDQIEDVIEQLKNLGVKAFPSLISNTRDIRYCKSAYTSILKDFSVGETCLKIISDQIDWFPERLIYKGMPSYTGRKIVSDPEAWWRAHASKSLDQIRVEVLRWTISEEQKQADSWTDADYERKGVTRGEWKSKCIDPLEKVLHEKVTHEMNPARQTNRDGGAYLRKDKIGTDSRR